MNTLMVISANLGNLLVLLLGMLFLLRPATLAKGAGLATTGPNGTAELRAFGGIFLALALAVFYLKSPPVYLTAGVMFIGASLAKLVSGFVDKPPVSQIASAIIVDAIIGACLLAGTQIATT